MTELIHRTTPRARLRRLIPMARPGAGPETRLAPADVRWMAAWAGLVAGLLEVGVRLTQAVLSARVQVADLRINHHAAWMTPVADLALLGALGLLLAPLARRWPRLSLWLLIATALAGPLLAVRGLHWGAAALLAMGLARPFVRGILGRVGDVRRAVRWSLPALVGGVAVLGVATYGRVVQGEARARAALPPARPGAPNVLMIVLDTVRADNLSLYGYARPTTPNLERLARRGVCFEQARSAAPWTLPSHASLFTGRWPHELSMTVDRPLDASRPTLAEFLAARGYATAGFVANTYYGNARYGLGRGFARYQDHYANEDVSPREVLRSSALGLHLANAVDALGPVIPGVRVVRKSAAMINRDALAWLDRRPDRPFFLFLNYYDAHAPYVLPDDHNPRFSPDEGPEEDNDDILKEFRGLRKLEDPDPAHVAEVTERAAEQLNTMYDDCLAYLDGQLGRLFEELDRRGLMKDTLVILTADHGDMIGEHQLFGHGNSLYRREIHVPLLVVGPSRGVPAGRRASRPVSGRDVPATVADLLGLAAESPFPGRSLARHFRPDAPASPEAVMSELEHRTAIAPAPHIPATFGPVTAVTLGRYEWIRAGDSEELFDLESDPAEDHNLADLPEFRATLEQLRAEGERLRRQGSPRNPVYQ